MNRYQNDNPFLSKTAISIYVLLAGIVMAFIINPWTRVVTPAGMQTVVVDTPVLFGTGGVREKALEPGSQWIWRSTTTIPVDPKPIVIPKSIDDFVSVDNILLDFESTVTVQVTDWPKMIQSYGTEWWKNNLERPYIAMVREQVKQRSMKDMMSDSNTAKMVDDNLTREMEAKVKELRLPVRIVEISLGRAKPNPEILKQMNETAAQQQRLLTLEQSRLAELKRKDEQTAKAEADNAYRNSIGLNVDEFVQLRLADKMVEACQSAKECVLLPPGTAAVVQR